MNAPPPRDPAALRDAIERLSEEDARSLLYYLSGYSPEAVEHGLADLARCATPGCGHAQASHWEHAEPGGHRKGCALLGCPCTAYEGSIASDEAAAALAASIEAGTPVVVEDDKDALAGLHDRKCACGHHAAEHSNIESGECLADGCNCERLAMSRVTGRDVLLSALADDAPDPHAARLSGRIGGGAS